VVVDEEIRVVLLEGLFVVGMQEGPWQECAPLMAGSLLLRSNPSLTKTRLFFRQMAAGKTNEEVEAQWASVNGANLKTLEGCSATADAVLFFPAEGGFLPERVENIPARASSVVAVGLNPALQKTIWLPDLVKGKVVRASRVAYGVGGKGQGCARAANSCGPPNAVSIVQVLGGSAGEDVLAALGECAPGLDTQSSLHVSGSTRTCTTVLCAASGTATEIIDPTPALSPEEVAHTLAGARRQVGRSSTRAVVMCGTWPPGVESDFYKNTALAAAEDAVVVLDAYKGIEEVLSSGRLDVLKINLDELLEMTESSSSDLGARALFSQSLSDTAWLAITDGANPGVIYSATHKWTITFPTVQVVNPIGAGDTCTGVMTYCMATRGYSTPEAFKQGLAAACASCLSEQSASFDWKLVEEIESRMVLSDPIAWN